MLFFLRLKTIPFCFFTVTSWITTPDAVMKFENVSIETDMDIIYELQVKELTLVIINT